LYHLGAETKNEEFVSFTGEEVAEPVKKEKKIKTKEEIKKSQRFAKFQEQLKLALRKKLKNAMGQQNIDMNRSLFNHH